MVQVFDVNNPNISGSYRTTQYPGGQAWRFRGWTYKNTMKLARYSEQKATRFSYDGSGQRTETRNMNGTTTRYFFPQYENERKSSGQLTHTSTYFLGGQAIATRQNGAATGLYYLMGDHLGSTTMVVNSSGSVITANRYYPFGEYRSLSGQQTRTSRGYTGHVQDDDDLGLIYMNARFYAAGISRFATADTIVPDPAVPQTFNRFSYVYNNPINLIDPTGHYGCSEDGYIPCEDNLVDLDPELYKKYLALLDFLGGGAINDADGFISSESTGEFVAAGVILLMPELLEKIPGLKRLARQLGDTAGGTLDDGVAIIRQYLDDNNLHFTIEVKAGDRSITTHQTGPRDAKTIQEIDAFNETFLGELVNEKTIDLPNATNAQNFQSASVDLKVTEYSLRYNSCVTHVCDVLRVGGAQGVPNEPGGQDLFYMYGIGFRRNP